MTPKALDNTAQGSKSPLEHAQSRSWLAQWPLELGPESQLARNGFDGFFTEFANPLCPVKHSIFVETTSHCLMKHIKDFYRSHQILHNLIDEILRIFVYIFARPYSMKH